MRKVRLRAADSFAHPHELFFNVLDAIIHSRITNDERALRRVIKKFSTYTATTSSQADASGSESTNTSADDAREAFLLELSSFSLQLKKAVMVCEAEARQVEEYYREKQRIEDEHGSLKGQIEQLKTSLEHAQVERRRKIEYDTFAEKISTLPTRTELEISIQSLENDMAAIRADQEAQGRHLQLQKSSLKSIINNIGTLRLMTKDADMEPSRSSTPDADAAASDAAAPSASPIVIVVDEEGEAEEGEDRRVDVQSSDDVPLSATLNPKAHSFVPSRNSAPVVLTARTTHPTFNSSGSAPPSTTPHYPQSKPDDDIEMGELAEEPEPQRTRRKARREDLEEGEASDESSELSDPPDD
ncbi:Tho complex subunit 7-domain-containing protein [Gloeopeniophorella convolvens]|nr:Tho complex subunit 7-domain-containing protein [Gloeopeniophorella convolvens]